MTGSRRRPPPDAVSPRLTAEGAAKAIRGHLPSGDSGLGPVGEETIMALLNEAKQEQDVKRLPYLFPKWFRDFFDQQHPERVEALDEMIDAHMERRALWKLWKRIALAAVPIGGTVYAYASGFLEKGLPLLKRILEAIKATPT